MENALRHGQDDLFYQQGKLFTGVAFRAAPDGQIESEQEYREGMLAGVSRGWFAPGQLESEAHFSGGLLHGVRRGWYETGRPAYEEAFERGVRLRGTSW